MQIYASFLRDTLHRWWTQYNISNLAITFKMSISSKYNGLHNLLQNGQDASYCIVKPFNSTGTGWGQNKCAVIIQWWGRWKLVLFPWSLVKVWKINAIMIINFDSVQHWRLHRTPLHLVYLALKLIQKSNQFRIERLMARNWCIKS